ncbi:malate dehydrogenase, cytoplasmic-like [Anneissia japonica]|uniref:malate dehydrogenase, cytoplasmic-like n=1 Tax=Anneissia japonica TaxID=1529436 RepID=UPI0014259007|nr:malate dehydrogenase, cytoplasmic-like [Anneissia japonica]
MALRVVVTGAAGQIAYSLLYSIAKGDVFGSDQKVELVLLDIPPMMTVLSGVVMELQDCALPLVEKTIATADPDEAFKGCDAVIMVGAMPRKDGMERKDLLKANARIFETQGKSLNEFAKKTVKVLVVGNPANTNCVLALRSAPSIPSANFTCLTRLDLNRAQAQVAYRLGRPCEAVSNLIIWGNHSSTQFPDAAHASVASADGSVSSVYDAVKDDAWLTGEFIKTVQSRGGTVLKARKLSSAMSAAKAIGDHMRDWWFGTKENKWVSMGVLSDGTKYGIPEGIIYSMPVKINADKSWSVVEGLSISDFAREKMDVTAKELLEEKEMAIQFLSA